MACIRSIALVAAILTLAACRGEPETATSTAADLEAARVEYERFHAGAAPPATVARARAKKAILDRYMSRLLSLEAEPFS